MNIESAPGLGTKILIETPIANWHEERKKEKYRPNLSPPGHCPGKMISMVYGPCIKADV